MDTETKRDIEHWIRFHKCATGIESRRAYSIVKALVDEVEHLEAALKPVLDCPVCANFSADKQASHCMNAVAESMRIYRTKSC